MTVPHACATIVAAGAPTKALNSGPAESCTSTPIHKNTEVTA